MVVTKKDEFVFMPEELEGEENFSLLVARLEKEMFQAAENLEFERAAELRDRIHDLKQWHIKVG